MSRSGAEYQEARRPLSLNAQRWLVIVGGILMNMALGTFYAMSAFLLPLEKEFGWTRAETSLVTTFGIVMISVWFLIGGFLQDRRGPRLVSVIGAILFSIGFLLASQIHSLLGFYLTLGVCLGAGIGFGYAVPTPVGAKWFPNRRGMVVGLMVGAYGAGSGIFGPLASRLIERFGWRTTFEILGALFFVMTSVGTILLVNPPPGYRPEGSKVEQPQALKAAQIDVSASAMLRTRSFWILWIAYCLGTTAGTMVISQLVPFARSAGHGAAIAAFAITVGAIGNASGRFFSGWISDYAGRLRTLQIMLLLSAIAMPLLFILRGNVWWFCALLAAVYYCYGTQLSVYAAASADFYGTRNLGMNYGLLLLAWGVAGILGPFLGGKVFVATGEYRLAFFISAIVSLVAFAVLCTANFDREQVFAPAVTDAELS